MLSEIVYSQLDGTIFISTFINEQNRFTLLFQILGKGFFFLKEINTFIQKEQIKLNKSVSMNKHEYY